MKVKANKGFSGFLAPGKPFNMHAGEIRDVEDNATVRELISVGYLESTEVPTPQAEPESAEVPTPQAEPESAEVPDEVKLNEDKRGKSKRG